MTTHKTMESSKEVKGNLIWQKRVHGRNDGHPDRPGNEDETLPVDVRDAAPKQQKAAKGEGVGRHDPLKPALGDVEGIANGGKDDDDELQREGL